MSEQEEVHLVGKYPSLPKQKRALEKRRALLQSGRELFIEKGYEQTNAKEIAAHAGVATGTFYRYFTDKRQLMMSLLDDQVEKFLPPIPNWTEIDPETFFATRLKEHYTQLDKLGLHRVLPEMLFKDPQFADVIAEAREKIQTRIYSSLKHAHEQGLIWQDLDLDTVAWSIMMLSEKTPEKLKQNKDQVDYQALSKVICRLVFPPNVLLQLKNRIEKDTGC